ncbi:hypothetical protein OG863_05765 [Streptomyces decoyicus]|uniref:Transcriptional regulator n=1 Tax=Streptomyces decoyicus TaxID=249567 RepID=A0ABZ1FAY0_9ACTN|nr:hypothetical protein [Streptomyces decoyicus]WSB67512.1 hypothetical protein OG863_05765 [Streptomyces decoyicus]
MNDTSVLASCLARLSWPPERLAREINKRCGTGTISSKAPYNWLKGACPRRRLPYIVAKILSDQLGESVAVEALWPKHFPAAAPPCQRLHTQRRTLSSAPRPAALDPVTASVDWLVADDAPPPSRTRGAEIPEFAVDMLTARIQQLRQLDDSCSSGLVLDWALQDLQWAKKLAGTYSYGPSTGLRLHRIVAELGQLTAWLTADQGMDELSNSRFLTALGAARAAGDRPLAAYIISCMSYRAAWAGRAEEALRLIRIARKGSAQEDMGIGRALLATREARAHASLGDEAGCQRALEEAAELSRSGRPSADPPWAYWLTPAVMVADAGRAWLELGRPRRAEWHLAHGIDLLRGSQPRNLLLHSASLAEARLAHREVDGAAEAAADALTLAESVTSQRAHSRLMALRGRFGRYDTPVAREIVQRADALLDEDRARAAC